MAHSPACTCGWGRGRAWRGAAEGRGTATSPWLSMAAAGRGPGHCGLGGRVGGRPRGKSLGRDPTTGASSLTLWAGGWSPSAALWSNVGLQTEQHGTERTGVWAQKWEDLPGLTPAASGEERGGLRRMPRPWNARALAYFVQPLLILQMRNEAGAEGRVCRGPSSQ